jgi:hypothetical protein
VHEYDDQYQFPLLLLIQILELILIFHHDMLKH